MNFFEELKRRNVFRVGVAYTVAAWVLLQVADLVLENIVAPPWVIQAMMLVVMLGFIAAVVIAWAYEMTPEGIRRETDVDRSRSSAGETGRKLDRIIIGFLALAVVYFVYDKSTAPPPADPVVQVAPEEIAASEIAAEPSIAVLPFADMSPDKDQEYFSDGISEELLNLLVRVDGLKVASRTSSFSYKGDNLNLSEIADELKVNLVLEGSVRKADNRVRITAQLIDAKTDRHLWSDTYDRELVDIFAIQDEIANAIVEALRMELGILQDAPAISVTAATQNLDAYELFLKARALFIARNKLEESISLFEQAVALDPEFARAWEGLGAVYSVAVSWRITDRDYNNLALEASRKALELNPDLSMPWAVIGVKTLDLEHHQIQGMEYLDRAINNDPKNTTAYLWRSIGWAALGFIEAAVNDADTCLELDPNYENCRRYLAEYQLIAGNTDLALTLYQEGAERGFGGSDGAFAHALMKRGNRLAVALIIWRWQRDDRSYPAKVMLDAWEFPERNHSQGLTKFLNWLESKGENKDDRSLELVLLGAYEYARPRDFDNSWIWSEEKQAFRQSPYFKPLIREMGLPDYWRQIGFPPMCRPVGKEDFECD